MTPSAVRRALLFALVAACAALAPFAAHRIGFSPAFVPAASTAVVMADLLVAALLAGQFLARGSAQLLGLACAFLLAGLLALAHALVLPGALTVHGGLGAAAASPSWLWAVWHGALPISLAAGLWGGSADVRRRLAQPVAPRRRIAAGACAVTTALAVVVTWVVVELDDVLPALSSSDGLTDLSRIAGPLVILADLAALVAVSRRGRRTELERRLVLVGACALGATVMSVVGGERFTIGWYAAVGLELLAGAIMLGTLLSDTTPMGLRGPRGLSVVDPLTGTLTRAAAVASLERLHRDRSGAEPLSLALLDVDRLRNIDDAHGNLAADAILLTVAERIRAELRDEDLLGRSGDEGFLLVLPGTDVDGATLAADRAVAAIRDQPLGTWAKDVRTTASAGVAAVGDEPSAVADALAAADLALNQAKANGRDQVVSPARATVVPLRRAAAAPQRG